MRRHHHIGFVQRRNKRHQVAAFQLRPCFLNLDISAMGVGGSVAVTGKMLDTSHHAGLVHPIQLGADHLADQRGIIAERAGANDHIVGVGIGVGIRRKVEVESQRSQISANRFAHRFGVGGIAGVTNRPHAVVSRHIKITGVGDPRNQSTFFVHRYKQRDAAGSLHIGDKGGKLAGRGNVFAKQRNTADRIFCQLCFHRLGQFGYTVVGGVVDLIAGEIGAKAFGANDKQLPDFLLQRHVVQHILCTGRMMSSRCGDLRWWCCGRSCGCDRCVCGSGGCRCGSGGCGDRRHGALADAATA